MLHELFGKIWETNEIPDDCKEGYRGGLEQAGFREDMSCTDKIATLRSILEQSLKWNSPVYATFVDYENAFNSVDREVL